MVICPTKCTKYPFSARMARRGDQLEALDVREIGVTDRSAPLGCAYARESLNYAQHVILKQFTRHDRISIEVTGRHKRKWHTLVIPGVIWDICRSFGDPEEHRATVTAWSRCSRRRPRETLAFHAALKPKVVDSTMGAYRPKYFYSTPMT